MFWTAGRLARLPDEAANLRMTRSRSLQELPAGAGKLAPPEYALEAQTSGADHARHIRGVICRIPKRLELATVRVTGTSQAKSRAGGRGTGVPWNRLTDG